LITAGEGRYRRQSAVWHLDVTRQKKALEAVHDLECVMSDRPGGYVAILKCGFALWILRPWPYVGSWLIALIWLLAAKSDSRA